MSVPLAAMCRGYADVCCLALFLCPQTKDTKADIHPIDRRPPCHSQPRHSPTLSQVLPSPMSSIGSPATNTLPPWSNQATRLTTSVLQHLWSTVPAIEAAKVINISSLTLDVPVSSFHVVFRCVGVPYSVDNSLCSHRSLPPRVGWCSGSTGTLDCTNITSRDQNLSYFPSGVHVCVNIPSFRKVLHWEFLLARQIVPKSSLGHHNAATGATCTLVVSAPWTCYN